MPGTNSFNRANGLISELFSQSFVRRITVITIITNDLCHVTNIGETRYLCNKKRALLESREFCKKNLSMRLKTVHQKGSIYTNSRTCCLLTGF